jgi:exonuclease III
LQPFRQSHTIIQSLNTRSLSLHFQNIETDHNMQTSHILCLNETKVKSQNESSHQHSNHSKYKSIVTYGSYGTMLLYGRFIVLDSCEFVTMFRLEFIVASFNTSTCQTIHIILVYNPPSLSLTFF